MAISGERLPAPRIRVAASVTSDPADLTALIVDDHPIARRGLSTVLREGVGVHDIIEADSAQDALSLARRREPDLVLLDLHMPGSLPGRELCAQLRAALPDASIVVVTAFDRVSEIRDCLLAGANGCLLKDTAEVDLGASLLTILEGKAVVDPRVAQELAHELVGTPSDSGPHG